MPLEVLSIVSDEPGLQDRAIFLSTSIPNPARWRGEFDALAITDAVVALARSVLTRRGRLITAAHPTIAPLILFVAKQIERPASQPVPILVYQSLLFRDVLPSETHVLAEGGFADMRWTAAAEGDEPQPGKWDKSLETMRATMLRENEPVAAVFIGGMEGIRVEFDLFKKLFPDRPTYALGGPGGEARSLVDASPQELATDLSHNTTYPTVIRRLVDDIIARL
jgi:hypothetical protein